MPLVRIHTTETWGGEDNGTSHWSSFYGLPVIVSYEAVIQADLKSLKRPIKKRLAERLQVAQTSSLLRELEIVKDLLNEETKGINSSVTRGIYRHVQHFNLCDSHDTPELFTRTVERYVGKFLKSKFLDYIASEQVKLQVTKLHKGRSLKYSKSGLY